MKIQFRKYPYPYRATLAITNDIDGFSFESFLKFHDWANNSLDLDIGDSFWFFSAKPTLYEAFSFFDGTSTRRSLHSEAIELLAETGHLDSIHTYGNFNQQGGFKRKFAEQALAAMESWKRKPIVWIDHGDEHNLQNVGHGRGDLKNSEEYHSDLTAHMGISFFWRVIDASSIWGHDRKVPQNERINSEQGLSYSRKLLWYLEGAKRYPLISNGKLRDGQGVCFFSRHLKSWKQTGPDLLADAFSPDSLDKLEQSEAAVSLLVHLGFGEISPRSKAAVQELKKREMSGQIGVMSTERLLAFLFARDHLVTIRNSDYSVEISWIKPPPKGILARGAEALHGLTLYVDEPDRTEFRFNGSPLPVRINPPDHTGQKSVTVQTWKRKPFPYAEITKMIRKG